MADASSSDMWTILAPVMVGGGIGIVAAWFGPWLSECRKEKAEQKKRRADKFEEMVAAIYELDRWVGTERLIRIGGKKELIQGVSPFAKLWAISSVYFPQFDNPIRELDAATLGYRGWMITTGFQMNEGGIEGACSAELAKALQPYVHARESLLTALKKFAETEFR